jgi:outer membrane protein insertion porin family
MPFIQTAFGNLEGSLVSIGWSETNIRLLSPHPSVRPLVTWLRLPSYTLPVLLFVAFASSSFQAQTASENDNPKTAPQVKEVLSSYEGQKVVAVELAGRPDYEQLQLERLIVQKEGEPFSQAKIDQTMTALKSSGKVEDVELEIRPQADGVRLMFVLQPAIYFGIYTFPGVRRFAYSRLLQVSDYPPRGAYSRLDVDNAKTSLTTFFQRNGFFDARVSPKLENDAANNLVNVSFETALGRHAKFGQIVFKGAPPEIEPKLQDAIRSLRARARAVAIRKGKPYSLIRIQKATQYLESRLISEDYLGARVELDHAEYDRASNRADVYFNVTGGTLAHVRVQGAHLWSWTRKKLLPMYEQSGLDPEIIQEGRQNLISHFQSKGYFDVQVTTRTEAAPKGQNIIYTVAKGQRHRVEDVDIRGNRSIPESQLRAQLKVKKAGFLPFVSRGQFSDQLVRQSVRGLEKVYRAEGFSNVKISPEVKRSRDNVTVNFHVEEGPQDLVATLQVKGNQTVPLQNLAPDGLKVVGGQPYSAKRVDEDRNQIIAQYLRMGYLNASFRALASKVGNDPHRLLVTYQITEGPRVIIDSVAVLGAKVTRPALVRQTVRLKTESPLREDELLSAESRLYTLGIFDWAQIDPRRQITTQNTEDVVVKLHENRKNEIRYGFGFEVIKRGGSIPSGTVALPGLPPVGVPSTFKSSEKTFWGPRGTFQYTRRNFRGLGESLTLAVLGARLVQRAGISYTDPFFGGAFWSANALASIERNSENPIFTSRAGQFGLQVQRNLNAAGNKTLALRYDFRKTSLTNLLIPDLVAPEDRNLHFSTLAAAYSFDTRDNPLDAKKGMYQTVDFDMNLHAIGSSVTFARLRAQVARYKDLHAGIVWANSIRIGLAEPFAGSRVPVSELFFSGGGSTLRGFSLNGAGPQRTVPVCSDPTNPSTCSQIQVPVGGKQLFILNSEFRFPLPIKKGLGFVAFYDGGNVYQHIGFNGFIRDYANTVGVGLRYNTPVGPVRVDLGHNLNAPPGIKSTQIFITLGQAF